MCLLFETIKVKENRLQHVDYHNLRLNKSRRELFGASDDWDIQSMINLKDLDPDLVYRCKFIYGLKFQSVDVAPYQIKPLKTLRLVNIDTNLYSQKYLDRTAIDQYKQANTDVDDIIFVIGNRMTDCTYANLVFFDGLHWITPSTPLLMGTKRQRYLDEQIISEAVIKVDDLTHFKKLKIINAMIDFEDSPEIDMENIFRS
jgi:4-amino-4-deoxychorismate lyase